MMGGAIPMGRWHFSREKFYDPEGMLSELHRLGFTVMLWICPFITPDTQEYRELEQTGLLVTDRDGKSIYFSLVEWMVRSIGYDTARSLQLAEETAGWPSSNGGGRL